jgi:hypothetical protein
MGLWPVLISLLEDNDRQVRSGIAWVCGTALQNNPDAQKAVRFFDLHLWCYFVDVLTNSLYCSFLNIKAYQYFSNYYPLVKKKSVQKHNMPFRVF